MSICSHLSLWIPRMRWLARIIIAIQGPTLNSIISTASYFPHLKVSSSSWLDLACWRYLGFTRFTFSPPGMGQNLPGPHLPHSFLVSEYSSPWSVTTTSFQAQLLLCSVSVVSPPPAQLLLEPPSPTGSSSSSSSSPRSQPSVHSSSSGARSHNLKLPQFPCHVIHLSSDLAQWQTYFVKCNLFPNSWSNVVSGLEVVTFLFKARYPQGANPKDVIPYLFCFCTHWS